MKTLNVNSYVRIKLTPYGIKKIKMEHGEEYYLHCILPYIDKEGYCKMQLWEVMSEFGDDLYNGAINLPFEHNIQIDDAEFES